MNSNIIILDGKAFVSQTLREVESDEFLSFLGNIETNQPNMEEPPLPDHCRWFFKSNIALNYVIEIKPSVLPIKHVEWRRAYKVAFPWQYFTISFYKNTPTQPHWFMGESRLGWSSKRIRSLDENSLSRPKLPNIYEGGFGICLGTTAPDSTLPPEERVADFISGFYSEGSEFNNDLAWEYPGGYTSIIEWALESRRDSHCWEDWDCLNYPRYSIWNNLYNPAYDYNGNLIEPVTTLGQLVERAQHIGRRPW